MDKGHAIYPDTDKLNSMKVLIFGASGATGHHLVSQAVNRDHAVTAFVRFALKFDIGSDRVGIFKGDVANYQSVEDAVRNHDAVVSALGASSPWRRDLSLIAGVRNITAAMARVNVKRFIYQSFLGVSENRKEMGFLINRIVPIVLKNVIRDHEAKEEIIVSSNLNWTIVRCGMLTNGPFTGNYRDGVHLTTAAIMPSVSRADVADFMLRQLTSYQYLLRKPRIMY